MAAPENQAILSEAGLFIVTESGDYLVTESFTETNQGGGRSTPRKIEEDTNELWEIGASIYSINDNFLRKPITKKKYILQENDIKVNIGKNISLHSLETLNENITVELLSNRIKE